MFAKPAENFAGLEFFLERAFRDLKLEFVRPTPISIWSGSSKAQKVSRRCQKQGVIVRLMAAINCRWNPHSSAHQGKERCWRFENGAEINLF